VAALETVGGAEHARALAALLRMESIAFDPAAVVAQAPSALDLAGRVGSEEARVDIAISLGLAHGHLGDPGALESLVASLADAKAARLPFQTIRGYVNAVDVAAEVRAHATVDRLAEEAMERLESFQTAIPRQTIQLSVARSLVDRGRFDEAVEWARASRRDRHGGVPLALGLEGVVLARRDGDGLALLDEAWAALADVPDGWRHAMLRVWRAEAAWLRGDLDALPDGPTPFARSAAELAAWLARARGAVAGNWRAEIERWESVQAPYEAALAALPGDERAAAKAITVLKRLGARLRARAEATRHGGAPRAAPDDTREPGRVDAT
jgi:hypothetical protein